ncbi:extracellular solute-binding protein [Cohnella sp. CFH 77786]|uniref:sugar ABC transporter substrate-binding protein n=1 Tax=Cohnella sp. CFH 77786 TaxID=2662265 RepID=UPI001C6082AC|nr:sugar ABC transporter substrate-binding protein [Cohnella sp. CFH 77786]MBW5447335.1 extracellular solute-binding protein [Cohnella sp. CFH 77786]
MRRNRANRNSTSIIFDFCVRSKAGWFGPAFRPASLIEGDRSYAELENRNGGQSMNRRSALTVFFLITLCALSVLSGCERFGTSGQAERQTAEPDREVTIKMWIMDNSPKPYEDLMHVMKPFLAKNNHIRLDVKVIDWSIAWTEIIKAISSGDGPDIVQLGTTWTPAVALMGGILDLSDRVHELGGADAYWASSWMTTKNLTGNTESVYAVPWFVDVRAVYYRTDAFKKANIDPDRAFDNWETFLEALRKVNGVQIDGKTLSALAIPGRKDWNVAHNLFPWIWAAGGDVLSDDYKTAAFNSEAALDGIMFYTSLYRSGFVIPESLERNSSVIENDFIEGNTAVIITGPWLVPRIENPPETDADKVSLAGRYSVAPMPAGPKGKATFVGGSNLAIFRNSSHKEESWEIIKYLSGEEAQRRFAQLSGFMPARKSVTQMPPFSNDAVMKAFVESLPFGRTYPSIPQWGAIETTIVDYFGTIWDLVGSNVAFDRGTIRTILDQAASEVDHLLQN